MSDTFLGTTNSVKTGDKNFGWGNGVLIFLALGAVVWVTGVGAATAVGTQSHRIVAVRGSESASNPPVALLPPTLGRDREKGTLFTIRPQSYSVPRQAKNVTFYPRAVDAYPMSSSNSQQAPALNLDAPPANIPAIVEIVQSSEAGGDPELGILRVSPPVGQPPEASRDPELGILRVRPPVDRPAETGSDPELGVLRVRPPVQQSKPVARTQSQPIGYLLARVSYLQTNNAFFLAHSVPDGLTQAGLTFDVSPALGERTYFVAAIDGNLVHYTNRSQFNYNQLNFKAGIGQRLTPAMYGEIGWDNQQLYTAKEGNFFLNEQAVYLLLQRRDLLSQRLVLDTFDEFRLSYADPNSYSRLIDYLAVSLSYYIRADLQVGIDYQFGFENYIRRDREDLYHRLQSRLTYAVSRNSYISVQGGLGLGSSSDPAIDFNSLYFGVSYTVLLGQF